MRISKEQRRLKEITRTYPLIVPRKCDCCGDEFVREKMWKVCRWGYQKSIRIFNYCCDCCPTKEDVINEIDTDNYGFGIAFVDNYYG